MTSYHSSLTVSSLSPFLRIHFLSTNIFRAARTCRIIKIFSRGQPVKVELCRVVFSYNGCKLKHYHNYSLYVQIVSQIVKRCFKLSLTTNQQIWKVKISSIISEQIKQSPFVVKVHIQPNFRLQISQFWSN